MAIILGTPGVDEVLEGTVGVDDTASYVNAGGANGGVLVDLSGGMAFDLTNGDSDTLISIENVTGSAFDDILGGDAGANVLDGGAGADQLFGGDGNDTLSGGDGGDQLFGGNGNDILSGGAGVDVLDGEAGDDVLSGDAGNDTLTGGLGADDFKYSFNLTQGGGETFRFTDFFTAHGGTVVGGEVADGTKQGQFSSLYTQWLESLGLKVLDLGQNSGPGGMPVVEGPDGTFGERESFTWTSGSAKKPVTHERWYSDTWSSGGGQDTATSGDGFDTIVDFTFGEDQLEFNGLGAGFTLAQFASLFNVSDVDTDNNNVADSTMLVLADSTPADITDNNWGVTVQGAGHTEADFYGSSIFS